MEAGRRVACRAGRGGDALGPQLPEAAAFLERAGIATASVKSALPARSATPGRRGAARRRWCSGAEVAQATINDSVSAIGDGRAARSVTVTPYVVGRVAAIEVASGDFVKADTPLVRLDSETEEIELDRARLTLADARDTLARNEELASSNALSEVQVRAGRAGGEPGRAGGARRASWRSTIG